jgi:hypothetical protein
MASTRLVINSLSGGVGRQAPTKRLVSEAENLDNCLVTLERSVEKRPPLTKVSADGGSSYLQLTNVSAPAGFNPDNLYFHFIDVDGFNRYCIVINRAGQTADPYTAVGYFNNLSANDFISVYRIEPTQWVRENVDQSSASFNRGLYEYLVYGARSTTSSYRMGNTQKSEEPTSIKNTFGSIDFEVGLILWNKLVETDYLPDNSGSDIVSAGSWTTNTNAFIHSGDAINYKIAVGPQNSQPQLEDDIEDALYWTNVRDNINFVINSSTQEEEETGQSLNDFSVIPQYPASEVKADVSDPNGWKAQRTIKDLYDFPTKIATPGSPNWNLGDYAHVTSGLDAVERDAGSNTYRGFGKVYFVRNPYLSFPAGFYRATRYSKNPYFQRIRSENKNSVIDHRRMPVIIYKDFSDNGLWKIKHLPLQPRRSGTDLSNPGLQGIGKKEKIQSMAVWKNRLWIAMDNSLAGSVSGDFFDFWINDVNDVSETDPIDVQASVGSYNRLSHIIPFQQILFVLSSGSVQFEVRGGSADVGISPFNVEFRPTSFYSTAKLVMPQKMANNVFFMDSRKLYMYLSGSGFSDEFSTSMEMTNHCKNYLPLNFGAVTVSSANNTIVMVDDDDKKQLYFYTFRTNGDKISQSAFYRWILDPLDSIMACKCYEKDMYLISRRTAANASKTLNVYFVSMETVPVTTPMIDWLTEVTGVYALGETKFTLPHYDPSVDYVIKGPAWGSASYEAIAVGVSSISVDLQGRTVVTVTGDLSAYPVYIGRSYEMVIQLSQQVQRSQDQAQVYEGVLNLKKITTKHYNSGSYDIGIARRGRQETKVTFYPLFVDSILSRLDQLKIDTSGEHLSKVLAYSENVEIFIRSAYPTVCNITNIEILGNFRSRNTSIE